MDEHTEWINTTLLSPTQALETTSLVPNNESVNTILTQMKITAQLKKEKRNKSVQNCPGDKSVKIN